VDDALHLIGSSQVVELTHGRFFSHYFAFLWPQITENGVLQKINGPAIRLYLWLLVEQEERARRNEFGMRLTEAEIARSLGVSRKTAGIYRQELEKLGLLKVKEGVWTVGYIPKSQRNT
jgi:predicted DNA-binding transcriptional regulator